MDISLRFLTIGIAVSVAVLAGITGAGATAEAHHSSSPALSAPHAPGDASSAGIIPEAEGVENDSGPPAAGPGNGTDPPSEGAQNTTDGPFAAAGLDQQVEAGTTVLLDGTGSVHENGRIVGYTWIVDPPGSESFEPCRGGDCARVSFQANETGRYEVTLTVRDERNRTATDSLYVTAQPDAVLSVQVDGQDRASVNETVPILASISPGTASLDRIEWYRDDTLVTERSLTDNQSFDMLNRTLDATGQYEFRAVVVDESGAVTSATHEIEVEERSVGGGPPDIEVEGPELITESDSRTATYRLTGDRLPRIRNHWTEWKLAGGQTIGSGEQVTVEWEPGVHLLRAKAYVTNPEEREDGEFPQERNTVGADGWKESLNVHPVTVDPAPTVSVSSVETTPAIVSGTVTATEPFSHLTAVNVSINGTTVATSSPEDFASEDQLAFEYEPEPGSMLRIVAAATDERGQTKRVERTVQVPEVARGQAQMGLARGEIPVGIPFGALTIVAAHDVVSPSFERSDSGSTATDDDGIATGLSG